MKRQTTYRIRNWHEYDTALVQRGSLTVWFSPEAIEKWMAKPQKGMRGRPQLYSDEAILCALMIRAVSHLPLRALQGFLESIVQLLQLNLLVFHYSCICRRSAQMGQRIKKLTTKRPTDLAFDSSGLKVYGEGEWKVRQFGPGKRRTWRKLHIAICPATHDIIIESLTENSAADHQALARMEKCIPRSVKRAFMDGGYDKEGCYRASSTRRGLSQRYPLSAKRLLKIPQISRGCGSAIALSWRSWD